MTFRRIIKRILGIPAVNAVVRGTLRFLFVKSHALTAALVRYVHVSGEVKLIVENKKITLWSSADDALVSKLYYHNNWENDVISWFMKFCSQRDAIIDAGANIGFFSIIAAKANSDAVIHAFEPNPYNAARLRTNVHLNGLQSRVYVHESALGEEIGHVAFYLPEENLISDVSSVYRSHSASFNDFKHKEINVSCNTLDRFCSEIGFVPQIVKIDVELYELQVLTGMKALLQSARPHIFCEVFNDEVKRKINPALDRELEKGYTDRLENFLRSIGYHFYLIVPSGILFVETLKMSPVSSMYLLLPVKLRERFYLSGECDLVLSELGYG